LWQGFTFQLPVSENVDINPMFVITEEMYFFYADDILNGLNVILCDNKKM